MTTQVLGVLLGGVLVLVGFVSVVGLVASAWDRWRAHRRDLGRVTLTDERLTMLNEAQQREMERRGS